MLLIDCPYCGMARPEIEFAYGGEAHIARPADPSALSDEEWAEFLYFRSNPKGVLAERWRHAHGCGRFFNCLRDTLSDKILATYKAGEPRPDMAGERAERARMSQPFRLAGGGSIDRSRPLVFTFDGLDYQGYAGDTLASALHRQRRASRRALVQISPPARHPQRRRRGAERARHARARARPRHAEPARDPDRALRRPPRLEPESLAVARSSTSAPSTTCSRLCSAPASTTRPSWARRWAWRHIYEPMIRRAAGLGRPRASPIPTAISAPSTIATCWSSAPARPASRRRWPRAKAARGWSSATKILRWAARCSPRREAEIDGKSARALARRRARRAALRAQRAADDRAPRRSAITRRISSALNERIAEADLIADPDLPRERLWQMRAREVVLATGAIERPLVFPDNDRPAVMLADSARALLQSIWRQGRRSRRRRDRA